MVWEETKEILRQEVNDNVFDLWIKPIELSVLQQDAIKLCCPDRFFSAYIARNYLELIQEKVNQTDPLQRRIELVAGQPQKVEGEKGAPTQLRLPHIPEVNSVVRSLHPRYTFDQFMVGQSNILAQSACQSLSLTQDTVAPCLYINSTTGLGKSHLTHAVAHNVLTHSPMTRLYYLTAQQFSMEMVNHIKANTMTNFKRKYHENCDVLLVEDIHALVGKKKTQEELNELLDSLIKSGKRVIFTANKAPRELNGIDGEFLSRMTSGLVTSIQSPDLGTRVKIVKNKARLHKLDLDEDHMSYVAQHIKGDVRQLESAIVGIRAKSQIQQGHVDMDLIKMVVGSIAGVPVTLSPKVISEFVSNQYNVSISDLQSRSRKKAFSFPRQVAMYLCRKHTTDSLVEIGREFNRDHSTVLHAIKVVTGLTHSNTAINEQVNLLSTKLKQF